MASKRKNQPSESGFVLGDKAFAQISAIEGLVASREMDDVFREFDRDDVSPEDRRRALIRRYGQKS